MVAGGIALVILLAVFALWKLGIFTSIIYAVTDPSLCSDAPYDPECYCLSGYNKREAFDYWWRPNIYVCELENMEIDPDSPTFEADALSYMVYQFRVAGCGCDLSCVGEDEEESIVWGEVASTGARLVNVECMTIIERYEDGSKKSAIEKYRYAVYAETGEFFELTTSHCTEPDGSYCILFEG